MCRVRITARWTVLPLAIALVAASWSEVQAQREGGRSRGGSSSQGRSGRGGFDQSAMGLLRIPQVQTELGLSDEQKTKLRELGESSRPSREQYAALRELPEEERNKKFAEMREKRQEAEKKLFGILNAEQGTRLKQILLQARGLRALADKEVAKELGLSEEQSAKIREIMSAGSDRGSSFQALRDLPEEERRKKFAEMRAQGEKQRQEAEKKVLAVLTDEQKQKLEKMKGKKFELPSRGSRNRPGGERGDRSGRERKKKDS